MNPEWTVFVRDPSFNIQGQLDDYQSLELVTRWRDVGSFALDIHRDNREAVHLTTPGWGIIAKCNGVTVFSGPITMRRHEYTSSQYRIKLTGMDDNVWLQRRLASPSPTESYPPYTVSEYDVRSGFASTIMRQYVDSNLGPSAAVGRRKAGLQVANDPGVGAMITGRARWQNLLTFLQELATAGGDNVGFRTIQAVTNFGLPCIEFQVYGGTDRTQTVKFSPDLGNLAEFNYYSEAPECNYVFVGGQGEGIDREIIERSDPSMISVWERIEGEFIDRRDTSDDTELKQAGDEALAQGLEKGVMSITPIDTPQQTYGTHYSLGDRVSVQWEEGLVQDIIREVKINLTPNGPQTIMPSIGNVPPGHVWSWFRTFRRLRANVIDLKRR